MVALDSSSYWTVQGGCNAHPLPNSSKSYRGRFDGSHEPAKSLRGEFCTLPKPCVFSSEPLPDPSKSFEFYRGAFSGAHSPTKSARGEFCAAPKPCFLSLEATLDPSEIYRGENYAVQEPGIFPESQDSACPDLSSISELLLQLSVTKKSFTCSEGLEPALNTYREGLAIYLSLRKVPYILRTDINNIAHIHPHTLYMLNSQTPIECLQPYHLTLWLDGSGVSKNSTQASWGFVAIVHSVDWQRHSLIGFKNGVVQCNSEASDFLGADSHTNNAGELSAYTHLLFWLLANIHTYHKYKITIGFDSKFANNLAEAKTSSKHHTLLVSWVSSLFFVVSQHCVIDTLYVKSHDGHPWNEFADVLCADAKTLFQPSIYHFSEYTSMAAHKTLQVSLSTLRHPEEYPALDDLDTAELQLPPDIIGASIDNSYNYDHNQNLPSISFHIVSINANTLRQDFKRKSYERQLHVANIFCAGIQEARSLSTRTTQVPHFLVASSECKSGNYGCEFWLSTDNLLSRHATVANISVLLAAPRLLIVAVQLPSLEFLAVVAHAPHVTSPDCTSWWEAYISLLSSYTSKYSNILYFMDANTQLAPIGSEYIGDCGSSNSTHFNFLQRFVDQHHVTLPSTFNGNNRDEDWSSQCTFSVKGRPIEVRIDYIGLSEGIYVLPGSCYVHQDFNMLNEIDDHLPVVASISFSVGNPQRPFKRRTMPYDKAKFFDPVCMAKFTDSLSHIPAVPFAVEPTSHQHILDSAVLNSMVYAFPKDKKCKQKQPYISSDLFEAVQVIGCHRRRLQTLLRKARRQHSRACFLFWKYDVQHRSFDFSFSALFGFAQPDFCLHVISFASCFSFNLNYYGQC